MTRIKEVVADFVEVAGIMAQELGGKNDAGSGQGDWHSKRLQLNVDFAGKLSKHVGQIPTDDLDDQHLQTGFFVQFEKISVPKLNGLAKLGKKNGQN